MVRRWRITSANSSTVSTRPEATSSSAWASWRSRSLSGERRWSPPAPPCQEHGRRATVHGHGHPLMLGAHPVDHFGQVGRGFSQRHRGHGRSITRSGAPVHARKECSLTRHRIPSRSAAARPSSRVLGAQRTASARWVRVCVAKNRLDHVRRSPPKSSRTPMRRTPRGAPGCAEGPRPAPASGRGDADTIAGTLNQDPDLGGMRVVHSRWLGYQVETVGREPRMRRARRLGTTTSRYQGVGAGRPIRRQST